MSQMSRSMWRPSLVSEQMYFVISFVNVKELYEIIFFNQK